MTATEKIHYILATERGLHNRSSVARMIRVSREFVRQVVKRDSLEYLLKLSSRLCPQCGGKKKDSAKVCMACRIENTPRLIFACYECGELKRVRVAEYRLANVHFCGNKCKGIYLARLMRSSRTKIRS